MLISQAPFLSDRNSACDDTWITSTVDCPNAYVDNYFCQRCKFFWIIYAREKCRDSISDKQRSLVFQDPVTGAIKLPDCVSAGLLRAFVGFIYVAIFQIGTLYVSDQYLFEPSFQKLNLIKKCLVIGVWGRINLYKYVSVWLITEGVCNLRFCIFRVDKNCL